MSSSQSIRELYRKLARESHPDLRGKTKDFHKLNLELKILTNEKSRWLYDRFNLVPKQDEDDQELTLQITKSVSSFIEYLGWGMFVLAASEDEPALNTKMSQLTLTLVFFLFDIYNTLAR